MAGSQPCNTVTLLKSNGIFRFEIAEQSPLDDILRRGSDKTQQWVSHTSNQAFQHKEWEFKPSIKFIAKKQAIEFRECWVEVFHDKSVSDTNIAAKLYLAAPNFTIRHFGPSPSNESNFYILLERRSEVAVLGEVVKNLGSPRYYRYEEYMLELAELQAQDVLEWGKFVCITIVDYEANRFFKADEVHNIIAGEHVRPVQDTIDKVPPPHQRPLAKELVLPALPLLPLRPRLPALSTARSITNAAYDSTVDRRQWLKMQNSVGRQTKSASSIPPVATPSWTEIIPQFSPSPPAAAPLLPVVELPPVTETLCPAPVSDPSPMSTSNPAPAIALTPAPESVPSPAPAELPAMVPAPTSALAEETSDDIGVLYTTVISWSEAKQEVADLLIDAYVKSLWDILKVIRAHRGVLSKEEVGFCARIGALLSKET